MHILTTNRAVDGRGAELLYGDRERRSRAEALNESVTRGCSGSGGSESGNLRDSSCSTRYLSEEERQQLKDRYSMEYSRYILAGSDICFL